jgi:hypothetical protein
MEMSTDQKLEALNERAEKFDRAMEFLRREHDFLYDRVRLAEERIEAFTSPRRL